jgi:hypothetical protein
MILQTYAAGGHQPLIIFDWYGALPFNYSYVYSDILMQSSPICLL